MLKKSLLALTLIFGLLLAGFAQVRHVKSEPTDKGAASATVNPFVVGERLNYDVSWSDFIVAGELTIETKARGQFDGREGFHVSLKAESVGLVKAVVYKVEEVYESYIDATTLKPFRAEKHSRRGKKRKETSVTMNQKRHVAHLTDGRKIEIPPDTYDVAALLYALRAIDLTQGKAQTFTMLDNDKLMTVQVEPEANEKLTTRTGKYNVVRVSAKTVEGRKTDDSFKIRLYITNDSRRLPVLFTADMSWGEVRAELTSATGTRQEKKK
ncbi:MAG: DUF3108 domain-containing protein [Blastocatellia bacterium]|nr:DUF3108 domain-containing protein [Blastocatellia bacterium]